MYIFSCAKRTCGTSDRLYSWALFGCWQTWSDCSTIKLHNYNSHVLSLLDGIYILASLDEILQNDIITTMK